ncbi:hypothetical protein RI367_008297 [Sorochytrium milnesiophthora]
MLRGAGALVKRLISWRDSSARNVAIATAMDNARMARITSAFQANSGGTSIAEPGLTALRDDYLALDTASKYMLWQSQLPVRALKRYAQAACRTEWGLDFLISVRGDILRNHRSARTEPMPHGPVFLDLLKSQIQASLFPQLQLVPITPDTDIRLQQKIVDYETVHPMTTLQELTSRMRPQRQVFAFVHPRVSDPIAFVEVALVKGISSNIQDILNEKTDPEADVDTAMFYSINSTMKGTIRLSGIDLGTRLIRNVIPVIQQSDPRVQTFCTLSPIPSFRSWLSSKWALWDAGERLAGRDINLEWLLSPDDVRFLREQDFAVSSVADLGQFIENRRWVYSSALNDVAGRVLVKLCFRYLTEERRDPVANFHLRNGACLHRLNWNGDVSRKGIVQSYSMMANYLYDLDRLEDNTQAYLEGRVIVCAAPMKSKL